MTEPHFEILDFRNDKTPSNHPGCRIDLDNDSYFLISKTNGGLCCVIGHNIEHGKFCCGVYSNKTLDEVKHIILGMIPASKIKKVANYE